MKRDDGSAMPVKSSECRLWFVHGQTTAAIFMPSGFFNIPSVRIHVNAVVWVFDRGSRSTQKTTPMFSRYARMHFPPGLGKLKCPTFSSPCHSDVWYGIETILKNVLCERTAPATAESQTIQHACGCVCVSAVFICCLIWVLFNYSIKFSGPTFQLFKLIQWVERYRTALMSVRVRS